MNICGFNKESIVDGPGLRYTIFFSGCNHKCEGCHNQESWDFNYGEPLTEELAEQIINEILDNPLLDGVTLSGGDPFFSPGDVSAFVKRLQNKYVERYGRRINVWAYTGFLFESLMESRHRGKLLYECDVIVDGKFDLNLRDVSILFRGSSNQRIINVHETLEKDGGISEWNGENT